MALESLGRSTIEHLVSDAPSKSFAELDARAQGEHREGSFEAMGQTARALRGAATTARERAIAANRLAGAYDGVGRSLRVLDAVREGLAERHIGADVRTMLTINLANAHYALWNLHESRAIAQSVLERLIESPARTRLERVAEAFARALRGHTQRRLLNACESNAERTELAQRAWRDLQSAEDLYTRLYREFDDAQYHTLAHTARGGALEARVAAGNLAFEEALAEVVEEVETSQDATAPRAPAMLECRGWWSVFGANIALRAREDPVQSSSRHDILERVITQCIHTTAEVGAQLEHWPMRERALTLQWIRDQPEDSDEREACRDWSLDPEELRVVVGAMGRFPFFRRTGHAILERAQRVGLSA